MLDVGFNPFVRRQTANSRFSHWTLTDGQVLHLCQDFWEARKPGYREGVCLVPVPPEGFFTNVVTLQAGDKLKGGYEPRIEGEEPRKFVTIDRGPGNLAESKPPAAAVDIILYHKDVLAEDGEQAEFEWNIISINANPTTDDVPIDPETLIANHLHLSGGTRTGMTDEVFVEQLSKSVAYWKNKTHCG